MQRYCQTDPRWAHLLFDGGPDTFGQVACFVTCFANLRTMAGRDTSPPSMEAAFAAKGLLVQESIQRDSALAELLPDEWEFVGTFHCEDRPCDPAETTLSDGIFRIMQLRNAAIPTHFVNITRGGDPPMIFDVSSCREVEAGRGVVAASDWKVAAQKIITYRFKGGPTGMPTRFGAGQAGGEGTLILLTDPDSGAIHRAYVAEDTQEVIWGTYPGGAGAFDSTSGTATHLGGRVVPGTLAMTAYTHVQPGSPAQLRMVFQAKGIDGRCFQKTMNRSDFSTIEDWHPVNVVPPISSVR